MLTGQWLVCSRFAIGLLAAAALFKFIVIAGNPNAGEDFLHFWLIPAMVADTPSVNVYDRNEHPGMLEKQMPALKLLRSERVDGWLRNYEQRYASGLHPTGSPFFYGVHGLAQTRLGIEFDYWLYQSISMLVLCAGLLRLTYCCLGSWTIAWIVALACLAIHRSIDSDIAVANVNRIQTGVIALCMAQVSFHRIQATTQSLALSRFMNRDRMQSLAIGFVLGLLVCYKANVAIVPLLLLGTLIIDRRWTMVHVYGIGLTMGVLGGFAYGARFAGRWMAWKDWKDYSELIWSQPFTLVDGNYATWFLWDDVPSKLLSSAITGVLLLIAVGSFWLSRGHVTVGTEQTDLERNDRSMDRDRIAMAIGLVIPLLSAPVAWGHYFVLSIPLSVLLLCDWIRSRDFCSNHMLTWIGTALLALVPSAWIASLHPLWTLATLQTGLSLLLIRAWTRPSQFGLPYPLSSQKSP
jgi:hypothetical protein